MINLHNARRYIYIRVESSGIESHRDSYIYPELVTRCVGKLESEFHGGKSSGCRSYT